MYITGSKVSGDVLRGVFNKRFPIKNTKKWNRKIQQIVYN
jgi:hypothetical protein